MNNTIYTLSIKNNITDAIYLGNITIFRIYDNRSWIIPINITISTPKGIINITNQTNTPYDLTKAMYTTDTYSYIWNITNTGTYNLTYCNASASTSIISYSTFYIGNVTGNASLGINETKNLTMTITSPAAGTYTGKLEIICIATNFSMVTELASADAPDITIVVTTRNGGGGGGGAPRTEYINVTTNLSAEQLLNITCNYGKGNGVCDVNENPWNCPRDCPINMDTLFITKESWSQNWFVNILILFISMIFVFVIYSILTRRR